MLPTVVYAHHTQSSRASCIPFFFSCLSADPQPTRGESHSRAPKTQRSLVGPSHLHLPRSASVHSSIVPLPFSSHHHRLASEACAPAEFQRIAPPPVLPPFPRSSAGPCGNSVTATRRCPLHNLSPWPFLWARVKGRSARLLALPEIRYCNVEFAALLCTVQSLRRVTPSARTCQSRRCSTALYVRST
ncbi:hypothetical protein GQ53DRAFT_470781 [Thozetella sp. PMI_491]|nr:hypothetical protein GQ53DRAFT_470781 [Thozetella sp. PMI_491]